MPSVSFAKRIPLLVDKALGFWWKIRGGLPKAMVYKWARACLAQFRPFGFVIPLTDTIAASTLVLPPPPRIDLEPKTGDHPRGDSLEPNAVFWFHVSKGWVTGNSAGKQLIWGVLGQFPVDCPVTKPFECQSALLSAALFWPRHPPPSFAAGRTHWAWSGTWRARSSRSPAQGKETGFPNWGQPGWCPSKTIQNKRRSKKAMESTCPIKARFGVETLVLFVM